MRVSANCVEFSAVRSRNAGKTLFLVPCIGKGEPGSIGSSAMPFRQNTDAIHEPLQTQDLHLLQDCIASAQEFMTALSSSRVESLPLAGNGPPESLRYPTNPRKEYMGGQ